MQRVALLNWTANLWQDYDYSTLISWIISHGVVSGLVPIQAGGAGTDITVPIGKALISVNRPWTPSQDFYIVFENTISEILTIWNNKKIFIEITQANINTPASNTNADGTWIWEIKIADSYPSANFIKLGETDWSWLLSIAIIEQVAILNDIISQSDLIKFADLGSLTQDIETTGDITATNLNGNWSWITNLSLDINWLTEVIIADWFNDYIAIRDASASWNRKILVNNLLNQTIIDIYAWTTNILWESNTQVNTWSSTYTLIKEISLDSAPNPSGEYRVSFEFSAQVLNKTAYAKIYKNWLPLWPEHTDNTISATWASVTEDYIFKTWDLIQLYWHGTDSIAASFRNFSVKYDYKIASWTVNL